ncbi:MAG: hypothetical protein ACTSQZ_04275 [Candidatus Thorarchaeota archaeon]
MNGKHLLLVLTHLFRKRGSPIEIEKAVDYLAFKMRYAAPSQIRRMLTVALNNEMITRQDDSIKAEFLFDRQKLSPTMATQISRSFNIEDEINPIN